MEYKNSTTKHIRFTRIGNRPLIRPEPSITWESGGVFAPAVILDGNTWKMLYRAYGADKVSRLGYAESLDGIKWKKWKIPRIVPIDNLLESDGVEDPRVVKIDGKYLITYTAYAQKRQYVKTMIRILETKDFHRFEHITPSFRNHWRKNDKDGVLFPQKINGLFCMLHRVEPNIQFSSSKDLRHWSRQTIVLRPTRHEWESFKVGAGAPPIKTDIGWLIFYHGVSNKNEYSMGAAILDYHSPTKILYRLPFPLLSPHAMYEIHGAIPNVVFGTSVIEGDDEYRLYYGGGDDVIAAAHIDKADLLETLRKHPVIQ